MYKQYTIPIHKLRLARQFDGFKETYGSLRSHIQESMQIKLAYLFRRIEKRKKRVVEKELEEERIKEE